MNGRLTLKPLALTAYGGVEGERYDFDVIAETTSKATDAAILVGYNYATVAETTSPATDAVALIGVDDDVVIETTSPATDSATLTVTTEWSAGTPSAGLITLASGQSITCASTARTAQQSATTRQGAYGANAPRSYSTDGSTYYLLVEGPSKNYTTDSDRLNDGANWATYLTVVAVNANVGNGPDGVANADEVDLTLAASTAARYCGNASGAANWAVSAWMKSTTGSSGNMQFENLTNGATQQVAITTALGLYGWKYAGSNSMQVGFSAGSGTLAKVLVSSVQSEKALYPQSYIPNVGNVQNSRAADVFAATTASAMAWLPGGYFDLTLGCAPLYAQNETAADHTMFFVDANNKLVYQQSTKKFVLTLNGVAISSSAVTFSRNQALTIHAQHLSTGCSLVVSGATTGNGTTNGSAQPVITDPGTCYFLGISTGAEEGAGLSSIKFAYAA